MGMDSPMPRERLGFDPHSVLGCFPTTKVLYTHSRRGNHAGVFPRHRGNQKREVLPVHETTPATSPGMKSEINYRAFSLGCAMLASVAMLFAAPLVNAAGPPDHVAFVQQPTDSTAGSTIPAVTVEIR